MGGMPGMGGMGGMGGMDMAAMMKQMGGMGQSNGRLQLQAATGGAVCCAHSHLSLMCV